jgi:cyclopropane fatty-acyl-phospholipid synthase-like methyltransferase
VRKPYAASCDENQGPILAVIRPLFADRRAVLEVGSGTGQHAVHFAAQMPHLTWHTSDLPANHAGIRAWLDEAALPNTRPPLALDVTGEWPALAVDAVFSANTTHIMHWPMVEALFAGVGRLLPAGGRFALYGPFNIGGRFTSESNARFDTFLRARDPGSGIRDRGDLEALATAAGMVLRQDIAMPANNRTLCWEKTAVPSGPAGTREALI